MESASCIFLIKILAIHNSQDINQYMTCVRYGVHMPNLGRGRTVIISYLERMFVIEQDVKKMLTMNRIAVVGFNAERVILS